jgi:hypothetical protein
VYEARIVNEIGSDRNATRRRDNRWMSGDENEVQEMTTVISSESMSYDAHHSPGGLFTSTWRLPSTGCGKCIDTLLEGSTSCSAKFEGSRRALTRSTRLFAGVMVMGVDSLS